MFKKILKQISKHKILSIALILILSTSLYFIARATSYSENSEMQYTIGTVEKGSIISTVSSTGQVNSSNQLDVKTTASTTVLTVNKKEGDEVKEGDLILTLDTTDIDKQIRSAKISLETAQNNYAKAVAGPTELELAQAQNSLQNARDNLEKLKTNQISSYRQATESVTNLEVSLDSAYSSALNTIDTAFIGFGTVMNDLRSVLYLTNELLPQDITGDATTDANLIDMNQFYNVEIPKYWEDISNSYTFDTAEDKEIFITLAKKATLAYKNARTIYNANISTYRNLSKSSSKEEIEDFLNDSITTAQTITESTRNLSNLYNYFIDYSNQRKRTIYYNINTYNTTLKQDTSSANSYLSQLITAKTGGSGIITVKKNLEDAKTTLTNLGKSQPMDLAAAENSLKIQQASYKESTSPKSATDIKPYQLAVQQAEDNLQSLQDDKDENYTIKAPFDGTIASLSVVVGDKVGSSSSSSSTTSSLVTVISNHSIAELSFTETDITNIKVGQKATLTFDSVEDLTITGKVIQVDTIGTTTQGVVSYSVKVSFDTEDTRIKPGMSVTANIITNSKIDVLVVANSAVKTSGETSYVEQFDSSINTDSGVVKTTKTPSKVTVEVGISDDNNTEITSGLSEGDKIITKTTTVSSLKSKTSSTSTSSTSSTRSSAGSLLQMGGDMGGGGFLGR